MKTAEEIRQKLTPGCKGPIRAVIYARVSTDNESQKDSCTNQVELAKAYIAQYPNIQLVAIFVDDGISGKNDFTRPRYSEMIKLLTEGGFDLIITKALSRLNRDEYNSLVLTNLLKENNATILTLEDNQVHDFEDINSGLIHSITNAVDAQYVLRQSLSGRKTQELRCKNKVLTAKDCSYGYDWHKDSKTITINETQAEILQMIYDEYVFHNKTPAEISRMLKKRGINICNRSVSNILQDERYIGNFYINKRTTKLGTGQAKSKRFYLPKEQWVLVERPDLKIIDKDLFDMAQRIHRSKITIYVKPDNKTTQARFQGTHLYAGKIFCPVCGKPYHFDYADRNKTRAIYHIKSHGECTNPVRRIDATDMEVITKMMLKEIIKQQTDSLSALEATLTKCVDKSQNNEAEIERLSKQKAAREKQINNLIDQLADGGLIKDAKERIKSKINIITEEINNLTVSIKNKENNKLSSSYVTDKIAEFKSAIKELCNIDIVDREHILTYIKRIELQPSGDINITLKTGQKLTLESSILSDLYGRDNVVKSGIQDVLYS